MTAQHVTSHIPEWTRGDRFRKAREDAGYTQQELALAMGVSRATVGNAELDDNTPLKITTKAWSEITGVPVEWLMDGTVPSPPDQTDTELMQYRYPRHESTVPHLQPLKAA